MDLEGLVRLGVIGLRAWLENLKQVAVAAGSVLKALQNLSSRRNQRGKQRERECISCVFLTGFHHKSQLKRREKKTLA
ncbi:hypothetical protein PRUPE_1G133200 [Prunus persica]|uniref:Uncharacterized protein n=1 Tax=Prunus persica TaxID=3760 RepID=A0A251QWV9_PRUPE|nr:hypothetical protein PRUPE_1G133200 [Prunus persica]